MAPVRRRPEPFFLPHVGRVLIVADLEGRVALDTRALHLTMARRVVHDRVVLGRAVIPERDTVRLPPEANLILRDLRLANQILKKLRAPRSVVLTIAHVLGGMKIREVRGKRSEERRVGKE